MWNLLLLEMHGTLPQTSEDKFLKFRRNHFNLIDTQNVNLYLPIFPGVPEMHISCFCEHNESQNANGCLKIRSSLLFFCSRSSSSSSRLHAASSLLREGFQHCTRATPNIDTVETSGFIFARRFKIQVRSR